MPKATAPRNRSERQAHKGKADKKSHKDEHKKKSHEKEHAGKADKNVAAEKHKQKASKGKQPSGPTACAEHGVWTDVMQVRHPPANHQPLQFSSVDPEENQRILSSGRMRFAMVGCSGTRNHSPKSRGECTTRPMIASNGGHDSASTSISAIASDFSHDRT